MFSFAWALGLAAALYSLGAKLDELLKPESRSELGRLIVNAKPDDVIEAWPGRVEWAFNAIYGSRHLSVRCVLVSSTVSILSFLVLVGVFLSTKSGVAWDDLYRRMLVTHPDLAKWQFLVAILFLPMLLNLVPDYVSLVETRIVMRMMSRARTVGGIVGFLLIDLVATMLVFAFGIAVLLWLLQGESFLHVLRVFLMAIWPPTAIGLLSSGHEASAVSAALIGTTLVSSAAVWLFGLSTLAARAVRQLGSNVGVGLIAHLDFEAKPLQVLGAMSGLVVTVAGLLLGVGRWATSL